MRICEEARNDNSPLKSISHHGARLAINGLTSSFGGSGMFAYRPSHEWVVIETHHACYAIQFAGSRNSPKPDIAMSLHRNLKGADDLGKTIAGGVNKCYDVRGARSFNEGTTLKDIIKFIENCDDKYSFLSNDAHTLSTEIYCKFADFNKKEIHHQDQQDSMLSNFTSACRLI